MVNFLLISDINEQTLKKATGQINFSQALLNEYLDETNDWYTEQALELRVDEDDIMVYNPNIDSEDNRNKTMVKLALYKFYKEVFFYEWGKDSDIFNLKYPIVKEEYNNLKSQMTYNRVVGISPAVIKKASSYMTIGRTRGESTSTNSDPYGVHGC